MIGRLVGTIEEKKPPFLLLLVSGVGYELEAPMTTFYNLPEVHATVTLHIHMLIREDAHRLFAFVSEADRTLFRALIKTSGVGPKLALAILSGMDASAFCQCVFEQNDALLTRLPGVGKKTARRLILEMKDQLESLHALNIKQCSVSQDFLTDSDHQSDSSPERDAISALISLGYKPGDAKKAVDKIKTPEELSSEKLIRRALKAMA